MATMLGIDAAIYYRSAGNFSSPTWSEITTVSQIGVTGAWNRATYAIRASYVEFSAKTTLPVTVTGRILSELNTAAYNTLWNSHISAAGFEDYLVLNAPNTTNGARGYRFEGAISFDNDDQGEQSVLFNEFTITPIRTDNNFQTAIVSSGAPVFTSF